MIGENVVKLVNGESIDPNYQWDPQQQTLARDQPALLANTSFQELERNAIDNPEVKSWVSRREKMESLDFLEEI